MQENDYNLKWTLIYCFPDINHSIASISWPSVFVAGRKEPLKQTAVTTAYQFPHFADPGA